MIPSLTTMAIDYIAANFDKYEHNHKLLELPEEVSNELLNKALTNPSFRPTEKTITLKATDVHLHDVPEHHRDEKIRYIFERYRGTIESLTLPTSFFGAFKRVIPGRVPSFDDIKNPIDACSWFFNTVIPELFTDLEESYFYEFPLGDTPFKNLKVLKLQGKSAYYEELGGCFGDSVKALVKLCPNMKKFHVKNCPEFKDKELQELLDVNSQVEGLFFQKCIRLKTFPEKSLDNLKSFAAISSGFDLLDSVATNCRSLEVFIKINNHLYSEPTSESSTVKILITDYYRVFVPIPLISQIKKMYPAIKLVILNSREKSVEVGSIPEGILVAILNIGSAKNPIRYLSKLSTEEEDLMYKKICDEYTDMILSL